MSQPANTPDIRLIFQTIARLPRAEQDAALERECGADVDLREQLRRMLEDTGPTVRGSNGDAADISLRVEDWTRRRDAETAAFWHGRRIGDFVARDLLGQGGMGIVVSACRAEDEQGVATKEVALKLVRPDLISAGLVRRLQHEHDVLSRLDHPGIARLHGLHLTSAGAPFLEMEKVEGETLDLYAKRSDLATRMHLLEDVARVVGYAHGKAVVHRDLKPNNVLVTSQGKVKLLDFGIAKTIEEESLATMTATGERLLTPRYAAPEQLLGGMVSAATDVFSLGIMLCELALLDDRPGQHTTQPRDDTNAHRTARNSGGSGNDSDDASLRVPLPRDPRLRQIARRALQTDPDLRYADGNELADELQRWRLGEAPNAGRWSDQLRHYWRSTRSRRRLLLVTLTIALVTAISVLGWKWQQSRSIDPGYGFIESDLAGLDAAGREQARRALSVDASGAREIALGLLQSARQRAPAQPLLTYLELTWKEVSAAETERQYLAASKALELRPNAYLQALLNAEGRGSASAATRRRMLNSALQLRPGAWRLRYALAHGEIGSGRLESALKQLQKIDIRDLRDRRAAQILSDRALLGDSAGARLSIDQLPADHPAWREWVMASIEFGEGDYASARQRFEHISSTEMEQSEPTISSWGRMGRVICLGQSGQWQQLSDLTSRELRRAQESGEFTTSLRSALLGAIAASRLGDQERLTYFLKAGYESSDEPLFRIDVALTAAALGQSPGDVEALIKTLPDEAESLAGLPQLLRAAAAMHAGDLALASAQLKQARIEGVAETRLAELEHWLSARVAGDKDYQAPKTTLWFAPWSNWVAAWVPP